MMPKFIIFCGPMFGSKTTAMMLRLERFELQKKKVRIFKPEIDSRYSTSEIVTHSGWRRRATMVKTGVDILKNIENDPPHVIALDEAFMVEDASKVLTWLFKSGITVIVSTLDLSFDCKPFKEVEKMLPWATEIHKCPAVCTVCGSDAFYTYRKSDDNNDIVIGGPELYEPRCFSHHPVINETQIELYDDAQ